MPDVALGKAILFCGVDLFSCAIVPIHLIRVMLSREYLVSTIIEQKALNKVARSVCAKNKFSLLKKKDLSTEDGNSIDIWSVGV